ncbi:MAG TPA: hypothetical protein VFJ74_08505 [Gemmatimonadaceae bacterium]|nr:hypothetical protein [Gemmatimonadaceae bacterium]
MTRRTVLRVALAAWALLVALGASVRAVEAQGGFGQNKVQYRTFDWHVLHGPHIDVYYYPAEEAVARLALAYGEESYAHLVRAFDHEVRSRIPLIVYASHSDFEQTNVLPFVPPEGVLGVTEFQRSRVTIPFRGSYAEFRHTVRHELVHVFQLSLEARAAALYPRVRGPYVPLWWSEGLAEYFSSAQDTRDDMIVRDVVLSGRLPSIRELNATLSPIVYPLGGELHRFLGERYGAWRIPLLYASLPKYGSFDDAILGVYGRTTDQLSDEWRFALRERYFPSVAGRAPINVAGREIATESIQPVAFTNGDSTVDLAYLSGRTGYTNIYVQPLDGGGRARVAVPGERSPEFESLHAFSSRIDARAGVLAFASKFGERDALFFWDVARNRVVGRYQFPSLIAIVSPTWSPDGKRVAFAGLGNGGISDLYVLQLPAGTLTRVTEDRYEDADPTWLPDGRSLVFSSDRGVAGETGTRNLFRVWLDDRRVTPLTAGAWRDETPRWDPASGRVVFVSDRAGTFNLYSVDTLGNGRLESRLDGGVFDPAPLPGGGRVAVTGFNDLSWSVYALPVDSAARRDTFSLPSHPVATAWTWPELTAPTVASVRGSPYSRRLSLDFAGGGTTTAPGYGSAQGGQLGFSDLLGDHEVSLAFASYGTTGGLSNMFDNFNADVFYLNRAERLNWGLGAFRAAGTFYAGGLGDLNQIYSERSAGVYGALRYPLSRFSRVEAQTRLEYSDRDDFGNDLVRGALRRRGALASNLITASRDNTLSLDTGPIDGTRMSVTGGVVSDVTHGVFENWLGIVDLRRYMRVTLQSAVAVRAFGYVSDGTRPRAIQVGGSWLLRGYPRFSLSGTHAWVGNAEYRFPLANFVTLGFPFGAVRFPQLQGAVFSDLGQAWYRGGAPDRVLGSAGVSLRMALIPGFVLRLDAGRRFSYVTTSSGRAFESDDFYRRRFVDFFFGYNY